MFRHTVKLVSVKKGQKNVLSSRSHGYQEHHVRTHKLQDIFKVLQSQTISFSLLVLLYVEPEMFHYFSFFNMTLKVFASVQSDLFDNGALFSICPTKPS